jgi:hypothetical protein
VLASENVEWIYSDCAERMAEKHGAGRSRRVTL